jgi:hypothetical protein
MTNFPFSTTFYSDTPGSSSRTKHKDAQFFWDKKCCPQTQAAQGLFFCRRKKQANLSLTIPIYMR